jgi:hypothetical protein
VAILVIVIGGLPKALGEPGLLDMPGVTPKQAGRLFPTSAAVGGRALRPHSFLPEYSWSRIASIISVPIGSFSKGMKFLVRTKYSLSMPFGLAASCFSSALRSSLVFMIAIWTVTLFIRPVVSAAVETYRFPRTSGRSALLRSAAVLG